MRARVIAGGIAFVLTAVVAGGCGDDSAVTGSSSTGVRTAGGQPRGGEASIEDFGKEASDRQREAIVAAFRGYFGALGARDYREACERMTAKLRAALERFAPRERGDADCGTALAALLGRGAPAVARAQANGEIAKVRVDDDRAFVVFHAPGADLFQLELAGGGQSWRSTTLAAGILVPSL